MHAIQDPSTGVGDLGVGAGSNSSPSGPGTGSGSPGPYGNSPIYGTDPTQNSGPSLAETLAGAIATMGLIKSPLGGTVSDGSFQPVAPQESGNVLAGRFGQVSGLATNWKVWVIALVVIAVAWYFYRRSKD